MADQTNPPNPPRTREDRVTDLIAAIHRFGPNVGREIRSAFDAERAEALAELRAGAEPIYLWRRVDGAWEVCTEDDYGSVTVADTQRRILYAHPPVAREAELSAEVERLRAGIKVISTWARQTARHERRMTMRHVECDLLALLKNEGIFRATTQEGKSPEPTPAEIEAAARDVCEVLNITPNRWPYWEPAAERLIALRAEDKAQIAELEAGDRRLRQALSDVASVLDERGPSWLARLARNALAAAPEKRDV